MRLQAVERGHRWKERLILGIVSRTMGEATDVQRVLFHRPEFLGRPLGTITHHAMRLAGDWSIAERELFAAYLSNQNRCEFCIVCHGEYASQAGDRALVERTLRDGVTGDARIDAALEFLSAFASGPPRSPPTTWTAFAAPGSATRRSVTWPRSPSRSASSTGSRTPWSSRSRNRRSSPRVGRACATAATASESTGPSQGVAATSTLIAASEDPD